MCNIAVNIVQPFPSIYPFQTYPGWHRTDLGLQLWGGQRGRQSAALLLRFHRVPWEAAVSRRHLLLPSHCDLPTLYNPMYWSVFMLPFFLKKKRKKEKDNFLYFFCFHPPQAFFTSHWIKKHCISCWSKHSYLWVLFKSIKFIYIWLAFF